MVGCNWVAETGVGRDMGVALRPTLPRWLQVKTRLSDPRSQNGKGQEHLSGVKAGWEAFEAEVSTAGSGQAGRGSGGKNQGCDRASE